MVRVNCGEMVQVLAAQCEAAAVDVLQMLKNDEQNLVGESQQRRWI
jgi:hypothetical protein